MRYQNPQFLYFLFAIAIPIIIHLFNLRREKKVYFSNISFLKEIKSERRKINNLKQILILISRILTICAIVFAFSRPYIPFSTNEVTRFNTYIYIDNSFSMDNISENGRLLDIAKEKSIEIIENSNGDQDFWIITNDFLSKENLSKNKEQARQYILSIDNSPSMRTKYEILEKVKSLNTKPATLFLVSDFQKNSSNISKFICQDSIIKLVLIPLNKDLDDNVSIDSCYLQNSSEKNSIITTLITNHSTRNKVEISVKLTLDDDLKTQNIITLLPKQQKEIDLSFVTTGKKNIKGIISIDDYPITFDNKLFFNYSIEDDIKVCQIYEKENLNIKKLFEPEENIKYTGQNINQLDINTIYNQNLIILNEITSFSSGLMSTINNYIQEGGSVCIIPSIDVDIENYNLFLKIIKTDLIEKELKLDTKISELNLNHPIFNNVFINKKLRKDIDLSSIYTYFYLSKNSKVIKENIYMLENGDDFLNYYQNNKGEIYLFTSSLNEGSNFIKHALFVTTFYNMAIHSVQDDRLYYIIHERDVIKINNNRNSLGNVYHLKSEETDIIADLTYKRNTGFLSIHNHIKKANHYALTQKEKLIQYISFNYSRNESNTEQYKEEELERYINSNNLKKCINIF